MRYLSLRPFSHEIHPTPEIRPILFGQLMTVLTGFHCSSSGGGGVSSNVLPCLLPTDAFNKFHDSPNLG